MYFFVRFTAIVMVVFGVLFMLAGVAGAIYGFVQNQSLLELINESLEASNSIWRLQDVRFLASVLGLMTFLVGMTTAALGQLMLVFVDVANETRETNVILRSMRRTSQGS
jgi:hypothetical protein